MKLLTSQRLDDTLCPHCWNKGSVEIWVWGSYYWFAIMPVMPKANVIESYCHNCKHRGGIGEMQPHIQTMALEISAEAKRPWWYFTGAVVFLLLPFIAFGAQKLSLISEKSQKNNFAPIKGMLLYKKEGELYSTIRISKVTEDSVFFQNCILLVDSPESFHKNGFRNKLIDKNNFNEDQVGITIQEIKDQVKSSKLIKY